MNAPELRIALALTGTRDEATHVCVTVDYVKGRGLDVTARAWAFGERSRTTDLFGWSASDRIVPMTRGNPRRQAGVTALTFEDVRARRGTGWALVQALCAKLGRTIDEAQPFEQAAA